MSGTSRRPVRLLVADDQPLLRTGFRTVLAAEPGIDIVGEAGNGADAVELARTLLPDVVLMGLRMPRLDGVGVTQAIVAAQLPVRVLLTAVEGDKHGDERVVAALRAGASGFLATDVQPGDLVAAIQTVAAGAAVLAPRLLRRLLQPCAPTLTDASVAAEAHSPVPRQLESLTDREREVLIHVARGLSNAEVAAALGVSDTTVKTHVGHILTKLGVRDRVQAVVLAYETGIVRPGPSIRAGHD